MIGVTFGIGPVIQSDTFFCYCTEFILGSFGDGLVNKIRHDMLAIILGLLRYSSDTNQWIKGDTMHWIIHLLDCGYLWYFNNDKGRHYVPDPLMRWSKAHWVIIQ